MNAYAQWPPHPHITKKPRSQTGIRAVYCWQTLAARGDYTNASDVDLIAETLPGEALGLAISSLERELARCLGANVDVSTLVPERSTPAFMNNYMRDRRLVYERQAG